MVSWRARIVAVAGCWLLQPLYLIAELAAAAATTAPYRLVQNTVSDLGATTCTTVAYPAGPVAVCSPWHPLLNSAVLVSGVLGAVGGVLLWRLLVPGAWARTAATAYCVMGIGGVGVALVPLDVDLPLHSLAALPALLVQPVALPATGAALRASGLPGARWVLLAGAVSAAGLGLFVAALYVGVGVGLTERLVLWPAYLVAPLVGAALGRRVALSRRPVRAWPSPTADLGLAATGLGRFAREPAAQPARVPSA